jgi:MFS family permease
MPSPSALPSPAASGQPQRGPGTPRPSKEKRRSWAIATPSGSTDIQTHYLTFNTPLPCANTTLSTSSRATAAPVPPDLSSFADPQTWPESRKRLLLALSCIATFLTAYTAGSYSPPSRVMADEFGAPQVAVLTGITTFCMGFALAPMVLAPFSEINGRYPVFVASGAVYVVFQAVCGLARDLPGVLVARFLVGVGGSVFSTMVGGVIADMWRAAGRNTPMALFSGSVLAGTGAGPLVAAVITHREGRLGAWRWVFWHQVIAGAVLMLALVVLFKESRGSVLLSRKAKALNAWYEKLEGAGYFGVWMDCAETRSQRSNSDATLPPYMPEGCYIVDEEKMLESSLAAVPENEVQPRLQLQRIRWIVKEDEERSTIGKMISVSLYRPFHLLTTEPVVFFFSLWVAFAWAVLYLTFSSVFYVFTRTYQWNIEQAGRVFGAMIVGSATATAVGVYQERLLRRPEWQPDSAVAVPAWKFLRDRFPVNVPEARLYFTCVTATLLPIGLFVFGFTARPDVHWMAPTIAVGLATMGIFSVYLATFNYLADVYHKYASSALAAQSCCRNVLGGVFPIVSGALFFNLGEARAGALLGGIGTALTLVPWVLVMYGRKIRARSKFAVVSLGIIPLRLGHRVSC